MSDAVTHLGRSSLRREFATRWQIPLLIVSSLFFGWGVWNLRPKPPRMTFAQLADHVVVLQKAGMYTEANGLAEALLAEPTRTPEEQRRLRLLLARIIYDFESKAAVRNPVNLERMIRNYRLSVEPTAALDAEALYRIGQAWEWLNRPLDAVKAYEEAIDKGWADATPLRRRIITLKVQAGALTGEALGKALDSYLAVAAPAGLTTSDVIWAAQQRTDLYVAEGRYNEAEAYLESLRPTMEGAVPEPERNRYDFLTALILYFQGRYDESERVVRALRNRMTIRDETDASSGWLLGRLVQLQSSPEVALSFFDTVCETHFEGPYVVASKLGRAECLAQLDRDAAAQAAYRDAVTSVVPLPPSRIVNKAMVIASATSAYEEARRAGKLADALEYSQIAAGLLSPEDYRRQAVYVERRADLLSMLAEQDLRDAEAEAAAPTTRPAADGVPSGSGLRERARQRFVEAGEAYLRLAKLLTEDESVASAAVWKAADRFDQAGERGRSIDVLEAFVQDRPGSVRIPAALLRLGQSYQALQRYEEAVRCYERNIRESPRTPGGLASVVPLAECFMAMGPEYAAKAEQTFLTILEEAPDRPPLLTPDAAVFRDALFRIADFYVDRGRYDQAIVRLEEALSRYPGDPRITRSRFQLAEAYRRSAAQMAAAMAGDRGALSREQTTAEVRRRLRRARQLYDDVIAASAEADTAASQPAGAATQLERARVRMSYLYRADCAFDEIEYAGGASAGYAEVIRLYDVAAWRFRNEPAALSAYVQIIQCYLRMGDVVRAKTTLERARWILRGIAEEADVWRVPGENKKVWADYLAWLGNSPAFRER